MVAHTCNPERQRQEVCCKFGASQVYLMGSRSAKAASLVRPCLKQNQQLSLKELVPTFGGVFLLLLSEKSTTHVPFSHLGLSSSFQPSCSGLYSSIFSKTSNLVSKTKLLWEKKSVSVLSIYRFIVLQIMSCNSCLYSSYIVLGVKSCPVVI